MFTDADSFKLGSFTQQEPDFGPGRHLRLGARLARLKLSTLFKELADRVEGIESN